MITTAKRIHAVQEYYFSKKLREIADLNSQGKDIINLGIGSPDLPPSNSVIEKLCQSAKLENNHGYQNYKGIPQLREAFSQWYKNIYDVVLDPDTEILPLMGSKEGITYILNTYVEEEDEVLVPNPGYPAYAAATRIAGGTVKYYQLSEENGWLPDFSELESQDLSKVKLMWVNYPHMPTGTRAGRDTLNSFVAFAEKHNILLCNDNPYSLILNESPISVLDKKSYNVLELNSLSKSHNMAGWRVGMLAGHKQHISNILITKSNVDSGMFLPVQEAAIQALSCNRSWYEGLNKVYRKRKEIVLKITMELNCSTQQDQSGLFVWARLPEGITSTEDFIEAILREANVFITPGFIFGSGGEGYIRISLCSDEKRLNEAWKRIKNIKHKILK